MGAAATAFPPLADVLHCPHVATAAKAAAGAAVSGTPVLDTLEHAFNLGEETLLVETGPSFMFIASSVVLALACFVGNLLVCFLYSRSRNLRRRANTFVLSLAASDVLVGAVYVPIYIYDTINNQSTHIDFFVLFITSSSILNHCALTYDRFVCIKKPLRYHRVMTKHRVRVILAAIWILPVINATTPALWMFNGNISYKRKMFIVKYFVLVNLLGIFLCTMLIFAVYGFLFRVARRHVIAIVRMTAEKLPPPSLADDSKSELLTTRRRRKCTSKLWFAELRAARTFLVIISLHFICWLPMVYINLCVLLVPKTQTELLRSLLPVEMSFVMYYGLLLRSCANPFLYALFKAEFRLALRRLFCKRQPTRQGISMTTRITKFEQGTPPSRNGSGALLDAST